MWSALPAMLALFALLAPASEPRYATAERRILVVSPSGDDPRIALARQAIAFWNDTFSDADLEPVFGEGEVMLDPPGARALETYARSLAQLAGRIPAGTAAPPPPAELHALGGDVVVLLSSQKLLSFAWPLPVPARGAPKYFLAISRAADSTAASRRASRNVIAHELGHVLGLAHQDDPSSLMCNPCQSVRGAADDEGFRPLTARDLQRLRELYAPADR